MLDVNLGGEAAFVYHRPTERPIHLHQRAAAARAGAGGAAEAMIAGHNLAIVDLVRIDVPQKKRVTPAIAAGPLHVELSVEIAIVNFAAPARSSRRVYPE